MVLVENCESGHEHPGDGAPISLLGELPEASLCSSSKKGSEKSHHRAFSLSEVLGSRLWQCEQQP